MEQAPQNSFLEDRARYIRIFYKDFKITPQQLADHYGMSLECVRSILLPRGAPLDHEGIRLRMNVIFPRWARGENVVFLAKQYNCSRDAMLRGIKKHAESIRPGLYKEIVERKRRER